MSETRRCGECRYFDTRSSLCRFNAPSVGWTAVSPTEDWCGEWTAPRTRSQAGEDLGDVATQVVRTKAPTRQPSLALTREARR